MSFSETQVAAEKTLLPCGRDQWDLAQPEGIGQVLDALNPNAVVHCAAFTAVDAAEDAQGLANTINAVAPGLLAAACAERGIKLIHISTDYVFEGSAKAPYKPDDPTGPIGAYGASKLAGEKAVALADPTASILRVSWLYDRQGQNFLNTMLRLSEGRSELTVVDDQWGCPTHAGHLAQDLFLWLDTMFDDPMKTAGIHHYGHEGITTWHGFASAIMAQRAPHVKVLPVPSSAFPTRAKRPAYSKLDESSFFKSIAGQPVTWQTALQACLESAPLS